MKVVVFGYHSSDWTRALGPTSLVWRHLLPDAGITHIANTDPIPEGAIVLPLMEKDIITLIKNHPTSKALVPPLEILETWSNKYRFVRFAQTHDLTAYLPTIYDDSSTAQLPCIYKPATLNNGDGVRVLKTIEELNETLRGKHTEEFVLQAYVPGDVEYTSHCVAVRGELVKIVTFKYYTAEYAVTSTYNCPWKTETVELTTAQEDVFREFLRMGNYSGPCNIDYKLGVDGLPLIFEVNPRFGGSLMRLQNRQALEMLLGTILKQLMN